MRQDDWVISYARSLQVLMRHGFMDGLAVMLNAEKAAVEREELPEIGYTRFKFEDGSEIFL